MKRKTSASENIPGETFHSSSIRTDWDDAVGDEGNAGWAEEDAEDDDTDTAREDDEDDEAKSEGMGIIDECKNVATDAGTEEK